MLNFDISQLVQETLNHATGISRPNLFLEPQKSLLPESPGVLYSINQMSHVFVIKMEAFENLSSINSQKKYDKDADLHFFECDNFRLANALKQTIANRRFALEEEFIFNISDPSDHWWLDLRDEFSLCVSFKLTKTHRQKDLVKLGPLGNAEIAQKRLSAFRGYFEKLFNIDSYCVQNGQWIMSIDPTKNHPQQRLTFFNLKQIWTEGGGNHDLWLLLSQLESQSINPKVKESIKFANYYLMELATLRRFWLAVEELL